MYYVERSRTAVGDKLFDGLRAVGLSFSEVFKELHRRIEVEITDIDEGFGTVKTRLDQGEWVNEGRYLLSGQEERAS